MFSDYCHFALDTVYYYYHYKRYAQWQIAKAWIDKPLFMLVVTMLIVCLGLLFVAFGCYKPKIAGAISAVGTVMWHCM